MAGPGSQIERLIKEKSAKKWIPEKGLVISIDDIYLPTDELPLSYRRGRNRPRTSPSPTNPLMILADDLPIVNIVVFSLAIPLSSYPLPCVTKTPST